MYAIILGDMGINSLKDKILRWFSEWARLKPRLHFSDHKNIFPKKREIWWASIGQNIGVEVNGKNKQFERPILIVRVFNADFVLAVSISSQEKRGEYYYPFINSAGEKNVVVLSQIRAMSSKRLVRRVGEMSSTDFSAIVTRLKGLL